jgi:hypothetical protein
VREFVVLICVLLATTLWVVRARTHVHSSLARGATRFDARAWSLLRALVPAWRFFDHASSSPELWYRVERGMCDWSSWQPVPRPSVARARSPLALLHNPHENLGLAYVSLLERLVQDLSELEEERDPPPEQLVSYELVLNLVRATLGPPGARGMRFQFKLTLTDEAEAAQAQRHTEAHALETGGAAQQRELDIVISRVHEFVA